MTGHVLDQKGQHTGGGPDGSDVARTCKVLSFWGQVSLEQKEREDTQKPLHLNSGSLQSEMRGESEWNWLWVISF